MMCRDEENLIRQWLEYHGQLFGYENLYVFDNGSSDTTADILKEFKGNGVHCDFSQQGRQAFDNKGELFEGIIKKFDKENPSDFYFPLDCDEFICVEKSKGIFSSEKKDIIDYLASLRDRKEVLMIGGGIDNNPYRPGLFRISLEQRKCFFTKNSCAYLDHGFHVGRSLWTNERFKTKIFYYHFHYRPYEIMIRSTINKLGEGFQNKTSEEVEAYIRAGGPGFHVARNLLITEDNYKSSFLGNDYTYLSGIISYMKKKNIAYPFINYAMDQQEMTRVNSEIQSRPAPWAYGFIDTRISTDHSVVVSGWCLTQDLKFPRQFAVWVKDNEIKNFNLVRTVRADVAQAFPGADEKCGFEIEIPLAYLKEIKAHGQIHISPIPDKVYLGNMEAFSVDKAMLSD